MWTRHAATTAMHIGAADITNKTATSRMSPNDYQTVIMNNLTNDATWRPDTAHTQTTRESTVEHDSKDTHDLSLRARSSITPGTTTSDEPFEHTTMFSNVTHHTPSLSTDQISAAFMQTTAYVELRDFTTKLARCGQALTHFTALERIVIPPAINDPQKTQSVWPIPTPQESETHVEPERSATSDVYGTSKQHSHSSTLTSAYNQKLIEIVRAISSLGALGVLMDIGRPRLHPDEESRLWARLEYCRHLPQLVQELNASIADSDLPKETSTTESTAQPVTVTQTTVEVAHKAETTPHTHMSVDVLLTPVVAIPKNVTDPPPVQRVRHRTTHHDNITASSSKSSSIRPPVMTYGVPMEFTQPQMTDLVASDIVESILDNDTF